MLPSTSSSWSLSNSRTQIPFYYALKNIQVVKNKPTDSVPLTNVYYLDRTYRLQTSRLVANNTSNISGAYDSVWDGWNSTGYDSGDFNINISNLINEKLDNGCTYNFYVYYDQIVDTSIGSWGEDAYEADEMLNTSVDSLLKDKNLIYASDANKTYTKDTSDKTTYNTGDQLILQNKNTSHCTTYMKIYIERVYDYKFVGDITISLDYSNGNGTVLPFTNDVTNDSNINNFYSNEIILPSSSYVRFGVNYGSSQTNNTVTIDSSADGSGNDDICYMPDSTTQYVNPSKQKVFYDQGILRGNIHPTDFSNPQNINVFEVINPGVYRFRIKVTYENGLPSSIKLSAAYIRGVFTEIFTDNPTDNIGNTKYVDHATYNYRLDNYYDNDLTSSSTFYSYGNHNASYSFSEVVSAGKVLIDHVLGSDVVIDPHNLIKKSNPDVIFYEVDPSTID